MRVVFYPPAFALALRARANAETPHPAEWDELAVLPLPWAERTIASRLAADWRRGLSTAAAVARNPFQRWAAQRGLHSFIHTTSRPLHLLYAILSEPAMEEFISAPTAKRQWRDFPKVKQVLLGELGGLWVDGTGGTSRTSERLVWVLTRRLRNKRRAR